MEDGTLIVDSRATMKAIVQDSYGSPNVLELADIDRPGIKPTEVLIRVRAAAVNPLDWFALTGGVGRLFFGVRRPRIRVRGVDLAGVVEAVGQDVKRLRPGDQVYGGGRGSFAEYASAAENELAPKPANLTFEQAAAVPVAGLTALKAIRDAAQIRPGQKALIIGAAGGVGTFAVQIARAFGAEVTGVCSTRNVDLVRSIGAEHVVDYTREDFTRSGRQYDVILDNAGTGGISGSRRVLAPAGTLIYNNGTHGLSPILRLQLMRPFVRQKFPFFITRINFADLVTLGALIEQGKVTPVIDSTYPLSEAAKAIGHVGEGHARGKVIVSIP
jgi:NADPH:quinone reductase-like Zn-dependent oxidoreductase